jgi:hypothetical protein
VALPELEQRGLRLEVKKPTVSWVSVLVDLIGAGAGGMVSSYEGKPARIAVVNRSGKHHVLVERASMDEADGAMSKVERDLQLLSFDTWCSRYDVPSGFADVR